MTADDTPPITLPATDMTQLAALLTEPGQFPRTAASSASTWPPSSATTATLTRDTSPTCSSMTSPSPPPACGTSPAARLGQPADTSPGP